MKNKWKSQCSLETLKQRAFLLAEIRAYFSKENVLEVETPILSSTGNTDVNIESFTSESINIDYSKSYLRTSSEFPLKRLLCSNIGDVYEIGKVFRRSEISKTHNIEFTMLEWYRVDYDYFDLIQDVKQLFKSILLSFKLAPVNTDMLTFDHCFKRYLNLDIKQVTTDQLNSYCVKYDYSGSLLTKDQAIDYLFATQVQPQLDKNKLIFITEYPASQAALAQIKSQDDSIALRFEVFYQGHELGNGYQELTDAEELKQRFDKENKSRLVNNQTSIEIDNNLLQAMHNGMPACSGIAIGVDRLLMVLLGSHSINEVLTFHAGNS